MEEHEVSDQMVNIDSGRRRLHIVRPPRRRDVVAPRSGRKELVVLDRFDLRRARQRYREVGSRRKASVEVPDLGEKRVEARRELSKLGQVDDPDAEARDRDLRDCDLRAVVLADRRAHCAEDVDDDVLPVRCEDSGVGGRLREERHDEHLVSARRRKLIPQPFRVVEKLGPEP